MDLLAIGTFAVLLGVGFSPFQVWLAEQFPTDHLIEALRLDPYLRFTASRHPQLSQAIHAVLDNTMRHKRALVHGDVSPKNILVSRGGRSRADTCP